MVNLKVNSFFLSVRSAAALSSEFNMVFLIMLADAHVLRVQACAAAGPSFLHRGCTQSWPLPADSG